MPLRPWTRDREGVLPPNLADWAGPDHPVRFVAAFVEELTPADWAALGVGPGGHAGGAPAYDPVVLLAAWLYGFMTGLRSCRKLATACAEQVWANSASHTSSRSRVRSVRSRPPSAGLTRRR